MAISAIAFAAASVRADGYDAHSYVSAGLVAQWDGIDNVGTGSHDATSKTWVDLTGNGYDAARVDKKVLEWANGNSIVRSLTGSNPVVKVPDFTMNLDSSFTFDFCGVQPTKEAAWVFHFMPAGKTAATLNLSAKRQVTLSAANKSYASAENFYTGGSLIACRDGAAIAYYNVTNNTSSIKTDVGAGTEGEGTGPLYLASYSNGGSLFKGSFHAMRIYNRPLTSLERGWNTAVDQIRFFGASANETKITVGPLDAAYGLVGVPALGAVTTVANTDAYEISLAGLSEHPDDGAMAREYATGCRARFHGWSFSRGNPAVQTTGTTTNGTVAATNLVAHLVWDVRNELRMSVSARPGGKIRINGGAAVSGGVFWIEEGLVTVEAVPDAGYEFVGWTGDLEALSSLTAAVTTCSLHVPTALSATFVASSAEPRNLTWAGGTSGAWNDGANWGGLIPGNGDIVTLEPTGASDTTVVLDTPTTALGSLVVRGKEGATMTLVVSNWMSRVFANTITVEDGGTIAVVGAFTDAEMSNRVWLAGTTLTVAAGGAIRANAAGYAGQNGPAWKGVSKEQHKPACGMNVYGGSYGGQQGAKELATFGQESYLKGPRPYGSAEWPFDPGTGAGFIPQAAGGAIYLDFSGAVTVNGEITADSNMTKMMGGNNNQVVSGHGSGGGIVIVCSSISGAGKVTANSTRTSNGSVSDVKQAGGGGGGGRIAVHYDTAAQNSASCNVAFEAFCKVNQTGTAEPLSIGEPGTVWFTDHRFVESGRVFDALVAGGVETVNILGDYSISDHRTGFDPGIRTVNFDGNLSISGTIAKMSEFILKGTDVNIAGNLALESGEISQTGGKLVVGGNFTMTNGDSAKANRRPKLHVYAPAIAGHAAAYCSATTKVCRVWTVGANASVYPYVDDSTTTANTGVPYFEAYKLIVAADGLFDARDRGWGWTLPRCMAPSGVGRGGEQNPNNGLRGGSHGGKGAGNKKGVASAYCKTYDSATEPLLPGSSAKASTWYYAGGLAGGVIRIVADRVVLNGSLNADGKAAASGGNGGSGGSIWVTAYRISGSGTMTANGGSSTHATCCYGGGGGRIAVYACRNSFFDPTNIDSNRVGVTAGASSKDAATILAAEGGLSENGTIYFEQLPSRGMLTIVR